MSNWQYANQVPTKQYRSANSIVRDFGLFEYNGETYCSITPAKEMLAARGARVSQPTEACEIVVTVKGDAPDHLAQCQGREGSDDLRRGGRNIRHGPSPQWQ